MTYYKVKESEHLKKQWYRESCLSSYFSSMLIILGAKITNIPQCTKKNKKKEISIFISNYWAFAKYAR